MQAQNGKIMSQWWRIGGAAGILFIVLFIIGIVVQGESPSRDDSIEEIRQYFSDDGTQYLVGDYIIGLAFMLGFIPFLVTLRWVLGNAEGSPPIWSWAMFTAGVTTIIMGAVGGIFWGSLALGAAESPEVDDSAVRAIMEMDVYAFTTVGITMGAFALFGGFAMFRTGVPWPWLGIVGLVAGILVLISSAWPIDGDEEGALAIPGFIGLLIIAIWILITSVWLIIRREEPRAAV